jgi:hypothetical protein
MLCVVIGVVSNELVCESMEMELAATYMFLFWEQTVFGKLVAGVVPMAAPPVNG